MQLYIRSFSFCVPTTALVKAFIIHFCSVIRYTFWYIYIMRRVASSFLCCLSLLFHLIESSYYLDNFLQMKLTWPVNIRRTHTLYIVHLLLRHGDRFPVDDNQAVLMSFCGNLFPTDRNWDRLQKYIFSIHLLSLSTSW